MYQGIGGDWGDGHVAGDSPQGDVHVTWDCPRELTDIEMTVHEETLRGLSPEGVKLRNWRLPFGGVFAIIAPCGGQETDGRDDGIPGG